MLSVFNILIVLKNVLQYYSESIYVRVHVRPSVFKNQPS